MIFGHWKVNIIGRNYYSKGACSGTAYVVYFPIECPVKRAWISKLSVHINPSFTFSEVNSGFFYKSAGEREKLVAAERKFIEERVKKIIELKNAVCADNSKGFVVLNQKV